MLDNFHVSSIMQSTPTPFPPTNKINEKASAKTTLAKAEKGYQNDI